MKTKLFSSIFVAIYLAVIAVSLSSVACNITPATISKQTKSELITQVREKPYFALIEGFQPLSGERMMILGQKISFARKMSVCATSGNHDEHMEIIREAHKYNQKIFIAGFSLGEAEAISLAEDCEKENIPVERLFLLDGVSKLKIPTVVKNAVDIVGTEPYMYRRSDRYRKSDLKNKETKIGYAELNCYHLEVPEQSYSVLLSKFP